MAGVSEGGDSGQARYDNWGGGGGGGGGVAIRFRPNTKSGGPLIVWHRAYSTLLLLPVTIMAEDPEHPLWDTLASAIYTCNR